MKRQNQCERRDNVFRVSEMPSTIPIIADEEDRSRRNYRINRNGGGPEQLPASVRSCMSLTRRLKGPDFEACGAVSVNHF